MKLRIATTAVFGLLLGTWLYLAEWSYERPGSLHETLNSPLVALAVMLIAVLAGFLVARPWVLLSLLLPIALLGYLQSTGKRGPDGISPLTSPPGTGHLIWFALMLGLGIVLAGIWHQFRDRRGLRST